MGSETKIAWAHHTFNPWRGCAKVAPECDNCYAEVMSRRNPGVLGTWGPGTERAHAAESYWQLPARWNREAEEAGKRRRVFCLSLGDWLEERADLEEPRGRLLKTIVDTPYLDWLLLSKRPEAWRRVMERQWLRLDGKAAGCFTAKMWREGLPPGNVWVGTSAGCQESADRFVPHLLKIPAHLHFLSAEPLIGPVELRRSWTSTWVGGSIQGKNALGWVIVGGESGPFTKTRPMDPPWALSLRNQCRDAGIAFFMKQLGTRVVSAQRANIASLGVDVPLPHGKGDDPNRFPEWLRVQEVPQS